jgi:hypothetical protein
VCGTSSDCARLGLVDDADLHAVQQRQAAALQVAGDLLRGGIVRGGLGMEVLLAEARVAAQPDERAAPPLVQHERPGAHRVGHQVGTVGFHHLARQCRGVLGRSEQMHEAGVAARQAHLETVAVQRAQAVHRRVVRKRRLVRLRLAAQFAQPQQPGVLELVEVLGLEGRVIEALDAVHVVGRGRSRGRPWNTGSSAKKMPGRSVKTKRRKSADTSGSAAAVCGFSSAGRAR